MKPLIILISTFLIALIVTKLFTSTCNLVFSGNTAMSVMLAFTAIGHFIYTQGMTMMIPEFIPYKKDFVYLTGFIEIVAAIGLLIPDLRYITSLLLIIFFVLLLSANIFAALKRVDYEKATYKGKGLNYLWFRVPLQLFFISWVIYFGLM
jgi:uncharacterized membrane protein